MKNKPSLHDIEAFNKRREKELVQEPVILEENLNTPAVHASIPEIIQLVNTQENEIKKLRNELAEVVKQLEAHKRLLVKQANEIATLKERQGDRITGSDERDGTRDADISYNKELILRNIVTLIEENGFSFNDVSRLFTLEGFLPPSPYADWNAGVVEKLYTSAKG